MLSIHRYKIQSIMKKSLLLFSCIMLFAATTFAQFGVKAGANIATMAEDGQDVSRNDIKNRSITGAVVGITYDLNIADIISIQPELLYSQSGGSNTYTLLGTTTKSKYKINYLEVPVLAKLKFGNSNKEGVGFHIAAGPWVGFALNGHYNSKATAGETVIYEIDRDYTFDNEDNAKRVNYGMIGAAGLSFGHLVFDVRYNYGFNNLLDNDASNNNDNKPVLQTRGVALTLGFTF